MQHAGEKPTAEHEGQQQSDSKDVHAYLQNIYKRQRRFKPRTVMIVAVVAIMIALLAADGLYTVRGLRRSLQQMATSMREGQAAIVDGDLVRAQQAFLAAGTQAEEAKKFADRPSLTVATWLPIVGNDAQILSQLPDVGAAVVDGGTTAIEAARALGATSKARLAKNIYRNGRVDFRSIDQGLGYLLRAGTAFREADRILAALPPANIAPVGEALKTTNLQVGAVLDVIDRADTLLRVLPDMMGRQGPRRYLVAFQSPSEARASGGFIGLYGILETRDGRAELVHVGLWDLIEQQADNGGKAPNRLDALLAAIGSDEVHKVNLSPSFESVSQRFLRVYRQATGNTLSGVLAVDPIALGYLTDATGPLKGAGIEEPITEANAVPLILRDSYIRFGNDPEGQTLFLETLIKDFYGKLGSGAVDAPKLANAFGKGGRSKHLKIYSTIPEEQVALREFGMDGSVSSAGPDVQFIFHNNLARNKVDYFLHREFDTTIDITRDNYAVVSTRIYLENRAPRQLAQGLGWQGDNRGVNEMALGVLMPQGASFEQMTVGGRAVRPTLTRVASTTEPLTTAAPQPTFPMASRKLVLGPKEKATVKITYRVADATDLLRGGDFALNLFPQATVRPDHYVVTIRPPVGFEVIAKVPGSTPARGGAVRFEGDLDQQVWLWTEVLPL